MARGLKFRIKVVEGLYYMYLCSENKDADQLRGYREADLRLCFPICRKPVFSRRSSNGFFYCKLTFFRGYLFSQFCLDGHFCRKLFSWTAELDYARTRTGLRKNYLYYVLMDTYAAIYFCKFLYLQKVTKIYRSRK